MLVYQCVETLGLSMRSSVGRVRLVSIWHRLLPELPQVVDASATCICAEKRSHSIDGEVEQETSCVTAKLVQNPSRTPQFDWQALDHFSWNAPILAPPPPKMFLVVKTWPSAVQC